jgi:hypothetical protein
MIDPFPDVSDTKPYEQPDDLFTVVPAIIGTLWDQSKVKRAEMLDAYSSNYYRGEIFPVRWKKKNNDESHPIACGAAMAFGGLLDISFRQHDFFLGRDNARNFYRTFFTLPCKLQTMLVHGKTTVVKPYQIAESHPIHSKWTSDMIEMFKRPTSEDGVVLLPIIPDLYMLKEKYGGGKERNPFERTLAQWPQHDATQLFALNDKLQKRVVKMLDLSYQKITAEKQANKNPLTDAWIKKYYSSNWLKKLIGWIGGGVLHLLFKWNKGKITSRITKAAIEWILKDLEEKKLL